MDLGRRLGELRRQRGLTQLDVSVASRVGLAQLDALERDDPRALVSELFAMAGALDVRVKVVYDGGADLPALPLYDQPKLRRVEPHSIVPTGANLRDALDRLVIAHRRRSSQSAPCRIVVDHCYAHEVADVVWGAPMTVEDSWADLPTYEGLAVSLAACANDTAQLMRQQRSRRWPAPVATARIVPGELGDDAARIYRGLRRDGMSADAAASAATLIS